MNNKNIVQFDVILFRLLIIFTPKKKKKKKKLYKVNVLTLNSLLARYTKNSHLEFSVRYITSTDSYHIILEKYHHFFKGKKNCCKNNITIFLSKFITEMISDWIWNKYCIIHFKLVLFLKNRFKEKVFFLYIFFYIKGSVFILQNWSLSQQFPL